ncbi:GNAT family N-acetyltransferase [Flavobacterium sp. AJR]|uniref:GNAT family N-acetyltransferase n=1 Tax=Flavobacterium sp. AJR TaxID=1979369 RepID=UPI0013FD65F2|nr:GNAT family protein [Flavobacterium sp. AJR]
MNQDSIDISNNKAISLQMVEIPQGQITLRDDRIKHIWTANIQPFLMAKYLVTQDLYLEITQDSPSTFKGNKTMIKLEKFDNTDFERLIKWADNEEMLVQFSGPIFKFPLTTEQLDNYLKEENRIPFKVIDTESKEVLGHAEIYQSEDNLAKLCRILIGDAKFRGKGIGEKIVNLLVQYSFEELNVEKVELNVYDWNKQAIKCYEKSGFVINPDKISEIIVQEEVWISLNMIVTKDNWKIN